MSADVHDVPEYIEVQQHCVSFIDSTTAALGISRIGQISSPLLNKFKKNELVDLLIESLCFLSKLTDSTTDFKSGTSSMKTALIESQQQVISLQSELLECKNEQLKSLNVAVKASVEDSVKAGFRTYSAVVGSTKAQTPSINQETLIKVVKTAVKEEDRSRNVVIFGSPEIADEDVNATAREIFESVGMKPRLEAYRFGRSKSEEKSRPIKVTFASSTTVEQILSKTSKLRQVTKFKSVFVCPDRSFEERIKRKELVMELKKRKIDEPEKTHFIKNDKVHSTVKS